MQSIINAIEAGSLNAQIVQVIASRYDIPAAQRAARFQLPYQVVPRKEYGSDISAMSRAILQILEPLAIDLILLCGFLSFLGEELLEAFPEQIMNIHPSLLPAFGGKGAYGIRVHQAVLEHGVKLSGCTVFFVDKGEDTGQIILQKGVAVLEDDTPETLRLRVMAAEEEAYPEAVSLFAQRRLTVEGRRVRILS